MKGVDTISDKTLGILVISLAIGLYVTYKLWEAWKKIEQAKQDIWKEKKSKKQR